MGLEVTLAWVESELFLISNVPVETHVFVSIIGKLEGHRLCLTNDAITNGELVLWEAFESNTLGVSLSQNQDLVLFVRVAKCAESQLEGLILSLFW